MPWDTTFESEVTALVVRVVDNDAAAWRTLMVRIAPHLEAWARASRVLRRCRLANEDDARSVMVDALERLAADGYANLQRFLAHTVPPDIEEPDDLVTEVVRLGRLDEDDEAERGGDGPGTPFRAWLIRLVDFVARDHVRRRLGWVAQTGEPSKRDLHTDAQPLDAVPEQGVRPAMTDRLTVQKLVGEVRDFMTTFPEDMQQAILLWLDDVEPQEIAARLALADAQRARALVRAGQARLRERFRGRSPLLFA